MSLGGAGGSQAVLEAVADAHRRGVVLVASAGNEADDPEFEDELDSDVAFPARYQQVIAVGATDFDDDRAAYSNFGPSLDLVAPGGGDNRQLDADRRDGVLSTSFLFNPLTGQASYGGFWATGTSFAAPHVAGLAALLISLGVDDPEALRLMLELTARDLFAPGFDITSGHGRIDAAAAHRGLGFTN
jgi:serine protease